MYYLAATSPPMHCQLVGEKKKSFWVFLHMTSNTATSSAGSALAWKVLAHNFLS